MQWQSSYPYSSPLDVIQLPNNILIFIWNYEGKEAWIEKCFYIKKELTGDHKINEKIRALADDVKKGVISKNEACKILARDIQRKLKGRVKIEGENFDRLCRLFESALKNPASGILTIAGALQWRIQYNILYNREIVQKSGVITIFEKK
jgi:hypothetical protein